MYLCNYFQFLNRYLNINIGNPDIEESYGVSNKTITPQEVTRNHINLIFQKLYIF